VARHDLALQTKQDEELLASIASYGSVDGGSHARLLLDWLFGRHPESTRTIAVLHYVDGLSNGELARIRGISVNTVKTHVRSIYSKLRARSREQARQLNDRIYRNYLDQRWLYEVVTEKANIELMGKLRQRRIDNPAIERLLENIRTRFGNRTIDKRSAARSMPRYGRGAMSASLRLCC